MLEPREERIVDEEVLRFILRADPQRLRTPASCIERISADSATYSHFFSKFLVTNKPVLVEGLCTDWSALQHWTVDAAPHETQRQINFHHFKESFGNAQLNVAECGVRDFSDQRRRQMTMSEYIDYWCRHRAMRADEGKTEAGLSPAEIEEAKAILYNKDWHYVKQNPGKIAYTLPLIFSDDWMNLHWDSRTDIDDDYRFVYMGPKGSWTPLHSDVFGSYSWSANVCGRKRWVFFPPEQGPLLKDKFGNLMYDIEEDQKEAGRFPHFQQARPISCVQEAGETIFVPSGWFHQVWNEEDTISINHNWANACNVDLLWATLAKDFHAVQKELDDCKDTEGWDEQCQLMLRTLSGWNLVDFARFVAHLARVHLALLDGCDPAKRKGGDDDEESHSRAKSTLLLALFSLGRLARVAEDLLRYEAVARQVSGDDGELRFEAATFARLVADIPRIITAEVAEPGRP